MLTADVLVFGDEIETLLAAISAAHQGARVVVLRRQPTDSWLGGLSTRGGLAYMDLTWDMFPPLFERFIHACSVKRVCLDPVVADATLRQWLKAADIPVLTWEKGPWLQTTPGRLSTFCVDTTTGERWQAPVAIDGTPDADVARFLGEPWLNGLNGLLDGLNPALTQVPQHLGVSPVFRLLNVDRHDLMAFEAACRTQFTLKQLAQALPWHTDEERAQLLARPCFSPDALDYVDILNPILGIAFHQWWHGDVSTYPLTPVWIDGGNVARLPDNSLSFNGMVTHAPDLNTLVAWSHYPVMPAFLLDAMQAFERFLQDKAGFTQAKVVPPQQLYVRQTVHVVTRQMATAASLLAGGLPDADLGPYSYWLDTRGINLRQFVPNISSYAKPVFRTHLDYSICRRHPNLAVVGRSAGYGPLAQGTCRIVQHAAWLAEALGQRAAMAARLNQPLATTPIPPLLPVTTDGDDPLCQREWAIVHKAVSQLPCELKEKMPL